MAKRIYPVDSEFKESSDKVKINGVPVNPDGTIDSSHISGSSGGGAFTDSDGDNVAELDTSHADFAGGEARGVAGLSGGITGGTTITNLAGSGLSISSGALTASGGGGGRQLTHEGAMSASGVSKATFSLSQTYDKIFLDIHKVLGSTTTAQNLAFRFQTWTDSAYGYNQDDGTTTTGASQLALVGNGAPSNNRIIGDLQFSGVRSNNLFTLTNNLSPVSNPLYSGGYFNAGGAKSSVSATSVSSFTMFYNGDSNITIEADVYGLTI